MSGPPLSYDPEAGNPKRLRLTAERMRWAGLDDLEAERHWVEALITFWEANLTFINFLVEKARAERIDVPVREITSDLVREILLETAGGTYLVPRYEQATFLDTCIARIASEPVGMLGPDPTP